MVVGIYAGKLFLELVDRGCGLGLILKSGGWEVDLEGVRIDIRDVGNGSGK